MNWVKRLMHKESDIFAVSASESPKMVAVEPVALPAPTIVAIGSGKGGVGKSLLTSTLGMLFAEVEKKALLIDADLGASNLHTFMGVDGGTQSLTCFLKGETANIKDLISTTSLSGLDLISG
ncbi:MAG: MinD/ParA family protein, partial [Thermodesulfobacteriota bacterium]